MTYEWAGEALMKADVSELFALIQFMLKIDPELRPSAEEVMRHPWFARGKVLAYFQRDIANVILILYNLG